MLGLQYTATGIELFYSYYKRLSSYGNWVGTVRLFVSQKWCEFWPMQNERYFQKKIMTYKITTFYTPNSGRNSYSARAYQTYINPQ